MNAWILVGGRVVNTAELRRRRVEDVHFVVAADGGIEHASTLGVMPHLWGGDFDSSEITNPRFAQVPRQVANRDKDFTDAELALHHVKDRGATRVTIWGAFGGRFDHTLALVLLAVREAQGGLHVELHSGDESGVPLLPGRPLTLSGVPDQLLSILALDEVTGLEVSGVRWPLQDARVPPGSGWTVSNEVKGSQVHLRTSGGRALVLQVW